MIALTCLTRISTHTHHARPGVKGPSPPSNEGKGAFTPLPAADQLTLPGRGQVALGSRHATYG